MLEGDNSLTSSSHSKEFDLCTGPFFLVVAVELNSGDDAVFDNMQHRVQ